MSIWLNTTFFSRIATNDVGISKSGAPKVKIELLSFYQPYFCNQSFKYF